MVVRVFSGWSGSSVPVVGDTAPASTGPGSVA
jgi:hypothetical protein